MSAYDDLFRQPWESFFTEARASPEGECLVWSGAALPAGYGRVIRGGRQILAHRLSYALAHGLAADEIPEVVRHSCDRPACVRRAHLIGGTHVDNVRDRVERGRTHRHHDDEKIEAILAWIKENPGWGAQSRAAAQFGVSPGYVSSLASGRYRGDGIGRYAEREQPEKPCPLPPDDLAAFKAMLGGRGRVPYGRSAELAERFGVKPRVLAELAKSLAPTANR